MTEKIIVFDPEPEIEPSEAPVGGLYRPTDNSTVLVEVGYGHSQAPRITVNFHGGLTEKKLAPKSFSRLQALRKHGPSKNVRYVEPKGYTKMPNGYFAAGPMSEANDDLRALQSIALSRQKPSEKVLPYSDNLPHDLDLDVEPVFADRGGDRIPEHLNTWRYWFTVTGRFDAWNQFRNRVQMMIDRLTVLRIVVGLSLRGAMAPALHQFMLWNRMGTRAYLRLRKYKKHGPAPLREVSWLAAEPLRRPDGSYLACPVEPPTDVDLQRFLDLASDRGLEMKQVIGAWFNSSYLDRQAEAHKAWVERAEKNAAEALAKKGTRILCVNIQCDGDGFLRDGPWGNDVECPDCAKRKEAKP